MTAPAEPVDVATLVGPFAVPVKSVLDLVLDARITDAVTAGDDTGYDRGGLSYDQVAGWIEDISAVVASRVSMWTGRLIPESEALTSARRTMRTLIATGAASYLEAARFPERASKGADSYAAVLWARFQTGLTDLVGSLEKYVDLGGDQVTPPAASSSAGIAGCFPPPLFPDYLPW